MLVYRIPFWSLEPLTKKWDSCILAPPSLWGLKPTSPTSQKNSQAIRREAVLEGETLSIPSAEIGPQNSQKCNIPGCQEENKHKEI